MLHLLLPLHQAVVVVALLVVVVVVPGVAKRLVPVRLVALLLDGPSHRRLEEAVVGVGLDRQTSPVAGKSSSW